MFGKLYISVRKWLQPYWNPRPKTVKIPNKPKTDNEQKDEKSIPLVVYCAIRPHLCIVRE